MKDERLVSKMEGNSNYSRRLKTGLWLDLTDPGPHILRQIYGIAWRTIFERRKFSSYVSACKVELTFVLHIFSLSFRFLSTFERERESKVSWTNFRLLVVYFAS